MFYYFSQAIDYNKNKTELTLFRHAFADVKAQGEFGNYRAKHGLEAAMPLFRKIVFTWEENAKNPIGDIMSGSVFSPRAAAVIIGLRVEPPICEQIDVEGTPAVFISTQWLGVDELSDDLDMFHSKKYRKATVVSERFKSAWEAAGLLGAEFEPITEDQSLNLGHRQRMSHGYNFNIEPRPANSD